jgi:hypothetical protein
MGRPPIGDRAMTAKECHQRWLEGQMAEAKQAGAAAAPKLDGVPLNIEHIRRYPDRVAPWLCGRLGHRATLAFRDALTRALAGTASDDDPP